MEASRKKNEKRNVFDVSASKKRSPKSFVSDLFYGRNVLNLRPSLKAKQPWLIGGIAVLILIVGFFGVQRLFTRAEVQDFFPSTCLGTWRTPSNAEGKPETIEQPGESFSAGISAMNNGSGTQIFCGAFLPSDFATSGVITNVGLTLVWQVGDQPMMGSATPPPIAPESSTTPTSTTATSSDASTTPSSTNEIVSSTPATPPTPAPKPPKKIGKSDTGENTAPVAQSTTATSSGSGAEQSSTVTTSDQSSSSSDASTTSAPMQASSVEGTTTVDIAPLVPLPQSDASASATSVPSDGTSTPAVATGTSLNWPFTLFSELIPSAFADDTSSVSNAGGDAGTVSVASPTSAPDAPVQQVAAPTPVVPVATDEAASSSPSQSSDTSTQSGGQSTTIVIGPPLTASLGVLSSSVSTTDSGIGPIPSSTVTSTIPAPAPEQPDQNFLELDYSLDGETWIPIQKVNPENWQDLTITLPISSWDDLKNVQVRVTQIPTLLDPVPHVYLDGMLLEAHYDVPPVSLGAPTAPTETPTDAAPPPVVDLSEPQQILASSTPTDFTANESPIFNFDLGSLPSSTPDMDTSSTSIDASSSTAATSTTSTDTTDTTDIPAGSSTPTSSQSLWGSLINPWWHSLVDLAFGGPVRALQTLGLNVFPQKAEAQTDAGIATPTAADPIVAVVYDPDGQLTDLQPVVTVTNDQMSIGLPEPPSSFRPGRYTLALQILRDNVIYSTEDTFTWGVLAVNFNKSIYTLNDTAHIGFGVLTDTGETVCNARIAMIISSPSGKIYHFSTETGSITRSTTCGPHTVTNNPDYAAFLPVAEVGAYSVSVDAEVPNSVARHLDDSFEVQDPPAFDVERIAPTRIYPPVPYKVTLVVKANQDYQGEVDETVPSSFQVTPLEAASERFASDTQTIAWTVNLKKGDTVNLQYIFLAPNISPELYKLGPLTIGTWQESRQWQIAADIALQTLVQSVVKNCSVATKLCQITFPFNNIPGNLILMAMVASGTNISASSTSDTEGDSFSASAAVSSTADGSRLAFLVAPNIVGGGPNTVNVTLNNTSTVMVVLSELSGVRAVTDLNTSATSTTLHATTTAGVSASTSELLYVLGGNVHNNDTPTAGANFTLQANTSTGSTAQWIGTEYRFVTATGSYQGLMNVNNTGHNWTILFASYIPMTTTTPPTISNVTLNSGNTITLVPNATTSISVVASTTPTAAALSYATATIYRTSLGAGCTANNLNCYQIASSGCTLGGFNATTSVTCSAPLWYFSQATDASSSHSGDSWSGQITVTDKSGLAVTSSTLSTVQLNTLLAINITTSSINYGSVGANANTGATNRTTTIQDVGNSSSTLFVEGTQLVSGGNSIATTSQGYATSSFNYNIVASSTPLTDSLARVWGSFLVGPQSTSSVSSTVFWGMGVPNNQPTGTYSGTNTFVAVWVQ